ncbi:MAG: hypothetical protein U0527_05595 [Candidatus Eisenbacteria bacterium]
MEFEPAANLIRAELPAGPRVAVLGSTSFFSPLSEGVSIALGRGLATLPGLALLTGGVSGVGQTVARAFHDARDQAKLERRVFHLLPQGMDELDYGTTLFTGSSMSDRREVLARVAPIYVVIEGGPGTAHESEVALAAGATLVPIAATGGHALDLYGRLAPPGTIALGDWLALGQEELGPDILAATATRITAALLGVEPSSD